MKQKIGDISSAKDVAVTQVARGSGTQEIGQLTGVERVALRQVAGGDDVLAEALELGMLLAGQWQRLTPEEAERIRGEAGRWLDQVSGDSLRVATVSQALRLVDEEAKAPNALRAILRDLSAAISAVSGTFAVSQLGDPIAVAIGVPAVLGMAGFLSSTKVKEVFEWIAARTRAAIVG